MLADTTGWVDHLRSGNVVLRQQLERLNVAMHPFIVTELALGSLRNRHVLLHSLDRLPQVKVAQLHEVRRMIEAHSLYRKGIGLTDAHLIASALITPDTRLWTLDKRLQAAAEALGVAWRPVGPPGDIGSGACNGLAIVTIS